MIRSVTGAGVEAADFEELPYQLVHRLASACSIEAPMHTMVYQIFGPSTPKHYADDLKAAARVIDPESKLGLFVLSCPFSPGDAYQDLSRRWDQGERDIDLHVRTTLAASPLLSFAPGEPTLVSIHGSA
jgi:hypothetical protein